MPESLEAKLTRNILVSLASGILLTVGLFLVRCLLRGSLHQVITVRYFLTLLFSCVGSYFVMTVVEDLRNKKQNRKIASRAKQHAQKKTAIDWSANLHAPRSNSSSPKSDPPS
ncbi:MAG: hypothetical protein HN909_09530 [Phycisphaerales bacterium]|jgi:hypothetical protein|nr:hypothetical protein [Phycisphaerales bacterium]MBT7171991.1 hypothetical protein [Phycisphaerales bacterium]